MRCELFAYPGARLEIGTRISAHQHVRIGEGCLISHFVNIDDNTDHDGMSYW